MVFSAGEGSKMSENQYAPLSPALVKQLTDKLYEKRKAAALEIERFDDICSSFLFLLNLKMIL